MRIFCRLVLCLGWLPLVVSCQPHEEVEPRVLSFSQAIVGGKADSKYPAVGVLSANKNGNFCTAALLSTQLVLTAAHCVRFLLAQQTQGSTIFFRVDEPTGSGTAKAWYEVKSAQVHPNYTSGRAGIRNDVGVVVLKNKVANVSPLPLYTGAMDRSWIGKQVLFLGYGLVQTKPSRLGTDQKHSASLKVRNVFGDRFEVYEPGRSICSGDSGGPGLRNVDGRMRVVGVNSYVQGSTSGGNANCDGSGWCFRVDPLGDWLQPLLNQNSYECLSDLDCFGCYKCVQKRCVLRPDVATSSLCQPCRASSDCVGNGSLCVQTPAGNRCMQACGKKGCCPDGFLCKSWGTQKQCFPIAASGCLPVSCQSEKDCGPGEACQAGVCSPKPVATEKTLCQRCRSNNDCLGSGVCLAYTEGKRCSQPCSADNFCPKGYECKRLSGVAKRQCVPAVGYCECASNSDCEMPFQCENKQCKIPGGGQTGQKCERGRHPCAEGFACFLTSEGHVCLKVCRAGSRFPSGAPGSFCRNAEVCDQSAACTLLQGAKVCLQRCTPEEGCRDGGVCRPTGSSQVCWCNRDQDCLNGTKCNKDTLGGVGVCSRVLSKSSATCPQGLYCQTFAPDLKLCVPRGFRKVGETCSEVKPCTAGIRCVSQKDGKSFCFASCQSAPCVGGGRCSASSLGRFCVCDKNSRCEKGYFCKLTGSNDGVCQKGRPDSCQIDHECPKGEVCWDNSCKQPASEEPLIEPEKEISLEKSEPFEVPNESVDGSVEDRKERRAERKTDAREETLVKEFLPESSCACSVEGEGSFALVWWVVIVLCGMRYGWRA